MTLYESFFKPFPAFKTGRLWLRAAKRNDLNALFDYCSREEVARYLPWSAHENIETTRGYLNYLLRGYERGECMTWVIERNLDRRVIGTASFTTMEKDYKIASLGYVISSDVWGEGYAAEAAGVLIRYGFSVIGLVRIEASCMCENLSSARVMEKLGMSFEGTLRNGAYFKGAPHDVFLYALTKERYFGISSNHLGGVVIR
ncbi:MAG TPA: GNAT family N-acetyltransferase [Ruminococcaceae bacterium]|nr:GNAT family N-acetyltransferase [Oscillospiraceae bacterium]